MDPQSTISRLADSLWVSLFVFVVLVLALFRIVLFALTLARGVYVYFLRPGKNLKKLGKWAVVTGATDGIGRAYADALAKKGLDLVLVSRTKSKLEQASQEITDKYSVQTKTIVADFAKQGPEEWAALDSSLAGLDIGVLVNNVGVSYDHAEYFHAIDEQLIDTLIKVNVEALTKVTRIVLPGMKERKRGAIVNIGSAAATVAPSGPLYAVYAGTKAYVDMFSKSLYLEYSPYGISVQNQAPAYVATKMSKIRRARLDAPSPAKWVAAAIKHIGYEPTSCPYWVHAVMWHLAIILPSSTVNGRITKMHHDLRKAYYRKLERDASKSKDA